MSAKLAQNLCATLFVNKETSLEDIRKQTESPTSCTSTFKFAI